MSKIKIMCTSTGCIEYAPERYRELGIEIIRIHMYFEGKEYLEGLDLDPVDFYNKLETLEDPKNNLPRTGIPTPAEIQAHYDAAIADGFTGNVALKLYEGVAMNLMTMIKGVFSSNFKTKMAYLLVKSKVRGLKKFMDYGDVGGAPLLGVKKPVIKAHGSSDARALKNAIRQALLCAENDVTGKISADMERLSAEEGESIAE